MEELLKMRMEMLLSAAYLPVVIQTMLPSSQIQKNTTRLPCSAAPPMTLFMNFFFFLFFLFLMSLTMQ